MNKPTLSNEGNEANITRGLEPKGDGLVVLHHSEQEPVWCACGDGITADSGAICGICASIKLAQPEQEPVAVWELTEDGWDTIADADWMETLPIGTKLYTAPHSATRLADSAEGFGKPEQEPKLSDAGVDTNIPLWGLEPKGSGMVALHQREWVGLTDADLMKEFGYTDELLRDTAYRVQQKLKEMNK